MSNYRIINNKIITSKYFLSLFDMIEKSKSNENLKNILFNEFQKVVLQTKCTFGFVYVDNNENKLRGRVGKFSGFRHGTQRLDLIPDNKWPVERSKDKKNLRYWDFGRSSWRSFNKQNFVIATSFWNNDLKKWVDTPEEANIESDWKIISKLNLEKDYIKSNREDTEEEKIKRDKINKKENKKRLEQIEKTNKKIKKSEDILLFEIKEGKILFNDFY